MTRPAKGRRRCAPSSGQVYVHSVEEGTDSHVRFLAGLRQLHTHYVRVPGKKRGQTVPCDDTEDCTHCKKGVAYVSKWYAPVLLYSPERDRWVQWVLEVSENLYLALRGKNLRGTEWRLWREGERPPRNPIYGDLTGEVSEAELIDPVEVDDVLRGFFRVLSLPRPGESRLPIRPTCKPVKATPPRGYAPPAKPVETRTYQRTPAEREQMAALQGRLAEDAARIVLAEGIGAMPTDMPATRPSLNGRGGAH